MQRQNIEMETLDPPITAKLRIAEQESEGNLLISYDTQLLRDICFNSATAIKYLGKVGATSLQALHSDIQAADSVYALPAGQPAVDGNVCTLTVSDSLSMILAPNYPGAKDSGLYDWTTVRRIKVMGINDVR